MKVLPSASGSSVSPAAFLRRLAAVCLLINLFVILLSALSLRQSHSQYEERAAVTTQNLAEMIEQCLGGSVDKIDVVLLAAKDEIEKELAAGPIDRDKLNSFLIKFAGRLPELDGLRMLDARGVIAYGKGVEPERPRSAADRDYFLRTRSESRGELFISRPFVSRIIGKWVIIFARRVNHPDGSFAGTIYGVVPLERLLAQFAAIDVGKHGTIGLRDGEMKTIVRYPELRGVGSSVGQKSIAPELQDLLDRGLTSGTYRTRVTADKVARIHTFRKIYGYPLYVNVGLATTDYLAEWWKELSKMAAAAALFSVVTLVISWLVYRDWQRSKSAVQSLEESEIRYRRLFQGAILGIFQTTREGRFITVNQAFAGMFGYATPEALMSGIGDVANIYAEPSRRVDVVRMILDSMGSLKIETQFRRRNGSVFSGNLFVWQVKDADGRLLHFEGFIEDITERKNAEEERRILEAQLYQAQKMEAVGQLAGGIAHDFNNLLTAILGNISLLKMLLPSGDAKLKERLAAAETASNRARELTQRLLTFSRGGAPVRRPVSLAKMVKESAELALSGSRTLCDITLPDDLWPVYGDEGQICQVMGNLLINAHQAMPSGGRITVSGGNEQYVVKDNVTGLRGKFVRLSIRDEGTGIDKEHLERIFEPFFTTKEEGRGLGLASSYSIIKNHEGYISVDSSRGSGATFTLWLPAAETVVAPGTMDKGGPVGGAVKVLVMDDEEIIREVAKGIIEALGYSVELASDGEGAIELYRVAMEAGAPFAAVIMDLTIPGGMGGKEAAEQMRRIDPQVRAIVSSGYSNDPIMANYREYGFVEVVSKPYDAGELSRKLTGVLKEESAAPLSPG